ncbi:MAG: EF-hand domain-containing protein [Parvibaculum sp.]
MKKAITFTGLGGLLLVTTATIALAGMGEGRHGPRHNPGQMFEKMDLNKDGEITREEAENAHAQHFSEADTDKDGYISAEEMQARLAARIAERQLRMFERKDKDKDGRLSPEEMTAGRNGGHHERMFERLDENSDGKITRAEADAAHERMRERYGARGHSGDTE